MSGEMLHILVLAGTTREQRVSVYAARYVAQVGEALDGVEVRLADPKDFHFAGDGNDPEGKDPRYTDLTAWADAFFIVTPEYNHSFPGSLKRMLDSEYGNYKHKAVALAGASSGGWGGVRAIEALVPTVRKLGLVVTLGDVHFPNVQDMFDEAGELKDECAETARKRVDNAYKELVWMATVLKYGRNNLE